MLVLISHGFGFSVLKNYPGWEWLARQVDHVAWEGAVFWDLIQPAFTFMVGLAMPLAFARRRAQGASSGQQFRHVLWRAFILIVLSNVLINFNNGTKPPVLQFINVLSQIAFGYVMCHLIMQLSFRNQAITAAALLAGYSALFVMFPSPGGPWSQTGNIGAVIDLRVLGYNYSGYYTTINFIGNGITILFGVWAGMLLMLDRTHDFKMKVLAGCAAGAFALGFALEPFIPMVKRLWTASFTFYSAGWVILMLMAFYWTIEMKGYRRWAFPMVVVGMNSIFIYSVSQVLHGWMNRGLAVFTRNFGFLGEIGLIPQNFLVMAVMWYLCYWLYQRRIFIKI